MQALSSTIIRHIGLQLENPPIVSCDGAGSLSRLVLACSRFQKRIIKFFDQHEPKVLRFRAKNVRFSAASALSY